MNLDGYIDVPTRLALALERFPDLRVTESNPVVITVDDAKFVQVTTTVWRTPDDPIPCRATAWEPLPGRTPFTRDSEMMNASTSALGRALGLMGLGLRGSISTSDEVRNRQQSSPARPEREAVPSRGEPRYEADPEGAIPRPNTTSTDPATDKQLGMLRGMMRRRGLDDWTPPASFSKADASQLISELKAEESGGN